MTSEIRTPTPEEMDVYLRRAHRARSAAFAGFGRQAIARLRALFAPAAGSQRPNLTISSGAKARAA
ncbi:MAG: hypothetical protein MUE49_03970 [Rhodospirillales bacterium]|nr:hypothetical protein [Rhodospirillales bacterium]